ncbi:MAG: DUF1805 domain-containing protein [Candidatus Omnitrophota bacterium]|jgi:uncharacterized protein YunC (DUF1805 family)
MFKYRKIKIDKSYIEAFFTKLQAKNLILLKGRKGYIMCGYLNLSVANKFKDCAAKIVGVSTIEDALKAKIHSCTPAATKLGIKSGQTVKKALKLIV